MLDLASVVNEEELALAIDDALRRSLTSVPRLRWALGISSHIETRYPDQHLIVEADSYRFRTGQKWHRDRNRNNNLVRLGWSVLYITSKDILHRPEKAIEVIRATLKAKGHPAIQDDCD